MVKLEVRGGEKMKKKWRRKRIKNGNLKFEGEFQNENILKRKGYNNKLKLNLLLENEKEKEYYYNVN